MSVYSRPSGYARWGWLFAAVNVPFALLNVVCLVWLSGGVLNWVALAISTCCAVYSWRLWRGEVAADAEHRAHMAEFDRRWGGVA